jgi:hypothetical protein
MAAQQIVERFLPGGSMKACRPRDDAIHVKDRGPQAAVHRRHVMLPGHLSGVFAALANAMLFRPRMQGMVLCAGAVLLPLPLFFP